MVNYDRLPEHMQDVARNYIEDGIIPGHFLMAVLRNNLVDAFGAADDTNRRYMWAWVTWLYNDIPAPAWGSLEEINAYAKGKQEELKVVT